MGEVVDVVSNIPFDSWIDYWGLRLPSDDLQVPNLESLEELIPVFLSPIRDL